MSWAHSGRPAPTVAANADADVAGGSLADVTDRLTAEFADLLERPTVAAVVRACRQDLTGSPAGALPELVERLAREELADRTGHRAQFRARGA